MSHKKTSITTGISLPGPLYELTLAKAREEDRSFSYIVRRALRREMDGELLQPNPAPRPKRAKKKVAQRIKFPSPKIERPAA